MLCNACSVQSVSLWPGVSLHKREGMDASRPVKAVSSHSPPRRHIWLWRRMNPHGGAMPWSVGGRFDALRLLKALSLSKGSTPLSVGVPGHAGRSQLRGRAVDAESGLGMRKRCRARRPDSGVGTPRPSAHRTPRSLRDGTPTENLLSVLSASQSPLKGYAAVSVMDGVGVRGG